MKAILTLALVFTMTIASLPHSLAQDKEKVADKAPEKDLTGAWDGANHSDQKDDWGEVKLRATEAGYIGTYSDTFDRKMGSITFKRTGEGRYEGLWWESSLQRYGSFVLEVPKDARNIAVEWKALSPGGAAGGKSTWKRK